MIEIIPCPKQATIGMTVVLKHPHLYLDPDHWTTDEAVSRSF